MEDYDEVVIKTVRDLFRSYPLIQIKKYMMTKEGEINDKDNELKSLILDKYTSLTHGFNGLEKISSNLESLVSTKKKFIEKMELIDFSKIELSIQNMPFNNELNYIIKNKENFNFDEINEKIENLLKEKKYNKSIDEMIIIKKYLDNDKNNFYNNDINLKEKYYFLLVELIEGILNKMIEDCNICGNIEQYKSLLDNIYEKLIKDKYEESMEYLIMIEIYLKILYDENIKKIMEEYFNFFKENNPNFFSLNILLKILLLKISQILYEISTASIDLLFNDLMIDKYYSIYETLISIKLICDKYCNNSDSNDHLDLNNFYSFIKSEINKNMNSLLIIPKNSFQKLYLHNSINFWNKLFLKNEHIESEENKLNLLVFLYINKAQEQISNITSYMLKQYSIDNLFNLKLLLKNKNIKEENDIYLSLLQLYNINNDKIYKKDFLSIIKDKLYQFFTNINNNISKELNNDNNKIEYMNIIIKIINYDDIIRILKGIEYEEIINIINELILKNQMNEYLKLQNNINDSFKSEIMFELYLDNNQIKLYEENDISEALSQLIESFYEYEIKNKEHKVNIYLNIIDIYNKILKDFLSKSQNNVNALNKIFINDVFILYNINIPESKGDKINNLISFINDILSIDIKKINKNIKNYKKYEIINEFFTNDNYINRNINFSFNMNKYINNNAKKIEYLPIYSNKMHVYMLNKSKIDYSTRDNNEISTCYIYDYRIEENYLSIRQEEVVNNDTQNSSGNKRENNNMFGNITGKLFNLINDD